MKAIRLYISALLIAAASIGSVGVCYAQPAESASQSIALTQPQIKVMSGQIEITLPGDEPRVVTIYALTGQVVKSFTATPGANIIELPKGYYIVTCDRVSTRVVIK